MEWLLFTYDFKQIGLWKVRSNRDIPKKDCIICPATGEYKDKPFRVRYLRKVFDNDYYVIWVCELDRVSEQEMYTGRPYKRQDMMLV